MNFTPPPRRPRAESIVPMINVVFLLLIFFLMTSRLTPAEPFKVTPPQAAEGTEAEGTGVLYLSSEGQLGYMGQEGPAAIAAFVAETRDVPGTPQLRADGAAEAKTVAHVLKELSEAGLKNVALVVAPQ
ncbi:biopolymer transporter ExbD [Pseudooceanicola sp. CBS1P-1]|uniref:Biopolymer transporter ExbD n=2 Tax=Paracoccaceae TaxID=31989 RepID=A0A6L7G1Y1_9RHOB|nr:biopolymer transporter ExbD [Pseudooceanicola endophyticus]MXN18065.1 biopolymer transporter ExbD [Pseudooceanicola albus]